MKKKISVVMVSMLVVFVVLLMVGCGTKEGDSNTSKNVPEANQGTKIEKIVLYGDIKEFPSFVPILEKLKKDFEGVYDIQTIPVDWDNLTKVMMTGITSGQPADIYAYWPNELKTMIDSGMVLELTPYLDDNDGEWRNSFTSMLETGNYGGKIYGVPISGVFPLMYANKDILDQANVEIPEEWTWEEFLDISIKIKDATGIYPFGAASDQMIIVPREGIQSLGVKYGKLDEFSKLETSFNEPVFNEMLTNILKLNEHDLWYPGEGALTLKRDEEQSAFYQGKVAMIAEASSLAATITSNSDFNVIAIPIPTMGDKLAYTGSADGFMIPSNAPNKEAAIEIVKKLTSKEYLQLHADAGFLVSNKEIEYTNPIVPQIGDLYAHAVTNPAGLTYVDSKIDDYFRSQLLPKLFLKKSDFTEILEDLEKLRLEALEKSE